MVKGKFSIEGIVIGRNDDYEPDWAERMRASIAYNHALFAEFGIEYRMAFVEWNPPEQKPLLSPGLLAEFPFLRTIIVQPAIHKALCETPKLQIMLNFAYNPAIRTSSADFILVTSGDIFFGRNLVENISQNGLDKKCLYRAERVNIRKDLDYSSPEPGVLEDPGNIISIDTCTESPYDLPPFTNACGDFILMDRDCFMGIRGLDESIRKARLHLDFRFCQTALQVGMACELLGRIYHIDHNRSYSKLGKDYPDQAYDYRTDLPYANPQTWGLDDWFWHAEGDRFVSISEASVGEDTQSRGTPDFMATPLSPSADEIPKRIKELKRQVTPANPLDSAVKIEGAVDIGTTESLPHWIHSSVTHNRSSVSVHAGGERWNYAAQIPLDLSGLDFETCYYWTRLVIRVNKGSMGVGILEGEDLVVEITLDSGPEEVVVNLPIQNLRATHILIRKTSTGDQPSSAEIFNVSVLGSTKD